MAGNCENSAESMQAASDADYPKYKITKILCEELVFILHMHEKYSSFFELQFFIYVVL